jgi:hypothetical protein
MPAVIVAKHGLKLAAVAALYAASSTFIACSSSSSGGSATESDSGLAEGGEAGGGGVDATIDVVDNASNCVKPGTANNAQGIGGYCNSGGAQCAMAGPGGTPTLCSADVTGVANAWFCTVACPTNCGGGASCVNTTQGDYCVPTACVAVLADAGVIVPEGGEVEASAPDSGSTEASTSDGAAGD